MHGWFALALLWSVASPVASLRRADAGPELGKSDVLVPFYMYELPDWTERCKTSMYVHQNYHPDVAFHAIMKDHPWRVADESAAKLFVVPGYFGLSVAGFCGSHKDNMEEVAGMLNKSSSYSRSQGRDHVMSGFSWKVQPHWMAALRNHVANMTVLHYENSYNGTVVVPYGSVGVRFPAFERVQHGERTRSLFFIGQADNRYSHRTRRRALHLLPPSWNDSVLVRTLVRNFSRHVKERWDDPASLKTELPPCEYPHRVAGCWMKEVAEEYMVLGEQCNYSLVMHGDTASTSHLYDAFVFDQVPIVISKDFRRYGMAFGDDLPWQDFAVFVDQDAFVEDAVATMRSAVAEASRPERLEMLRRVRPALDWTWGGDCMGTAVLLHVAREFHGAQSLPRILDMPECRAPAPAAVSMRRRALSPADASSALLDAIAMDGRFD